jgi:predicted alpha/beta-hydrolase family hydrolase
MMESFLDDSAQPAVRGFIHHPETKCADGLVLTHGAGANCQSRLLLVVAQAFAASGLTVLRCDLPFRQQRPHGPPFPGIAGNDREGLRRAVQAMKNLVPGRVFLGGHSYGGRQATMLAAESEEKDQHLAAGLLLLSYPLHPPRKPSELRTAHFPQLRTPSLFVHGTRDPFGTPDEMKSALQLIPGDNMLLDIPGTGHELLSPKIAKDLPAQIVDAFMNFFRREHLQSSLPVR